MQVISFGWWKIKFIRSLISEWANVVIGGGGGG